MSTTTPVSTTVLAGLEEHVHAAAVPTLVLLAAHVTGDLSLLRPEWKPSAAVLPQSGLDPATDEEARAVCAARLAEAISSGEPWPNQPTEEFLRAVADWALDSDDDDIAALLSVAFVAEGTDPRAPRWTIDEVAPDRPFRAIVIGSGIAGLMVGLRLKQAGIDFTIYEKAPHIGGTWWENTYPDCRTDVHSHIYTYSFQAHDWPSYFGRQEVILDYLTDFAKNNGLLEHIRFNTEVSDATWDEQSSRWNVGIIDPDRKAAVESADILVSAVGQLNRPMIPDLPGLDGFSGPAFHSAEWDHSIDFTGKNVAVIGTGASALQFAPTLARQAAKVTIYQRSAPWLMPTPELRQEIGESERWLLNNLPLYRSFYRFTIFVPRAIGQLDAATVDPNYPPTEVAVSEANERLRVLLTGYLTEQAGDRTDLLPKIIPDYPAGAKRIIRDDGTWVATLKRDNVELVTSAVSGITADGVVADGTERPADVIVFGTGFRASDFLTPMTVTGAGGKDLHDAWGLDACAYMGLTIPDFPNLFCMYGPNTGLVLHGNVVFFMECQANYVAKSVELLLREDVHSMSLTQEKFESYRDEIFAASAHRVWEWSGTHSWYQNAAGRSTIMWPLPTWDYVEGTSEVDPSHYTLNERNHR
ncbi:flavin-containing monooxygenase [Aeromicrobium choanae]|uniref:4-hydroxyacetophenone monooxygenase n=1 Tax=Aeromicrobium choanae TaxID=1736691 RepID=A0A1T4Z5X4_9ACTN|nr:NAD(P)/FAD-dependent oxidoreductase [Aeromicrobium choanae]SKB08945.1 4-hydroxyacetophenone monooxygenase [Aeromicrobium choanae]